MFCIVTHATNIGGKIYEFPTSTVVETLQREKEDFYFIRHSLDGSFASIIFRYEKGELKTTENIRYILSKFTILRYITEVISTVFLIIFLVKNKNIIYIGVDPLNAFSGIILQKLGKVKQVIFYTADYAEKRFSNAFLNYIYHAIDRFCVKYSNEIWSVSTRICTIRKKQGVPEEKNIFVPNVPSEEYKEFLGKEKSIYTLITLGIIGEQLDYIGLFDAIDSLREEYPQIRLKIIGNGPKEGAYQKIVEERKLNKQILFLGYLGHKDALKEIATSGIGFALYNGNWSFNYFGDSMKCREYFSFGLPVITTNTHSTVEEIQKERAGIVCKMDNEEYIKALKEIWNNYEIYSKNSFMLSKKYKGIHKEKLFKLAKKA